MRTIDFIRDKVALILLNMICALLLFIYLSAIGVGLHETLLVLIVWLFVLIGYLLIQSFLKKKQLDDLNDVMASLDKKYLFTEIAEIKGDTEKQAYFLLIKQALRSMTEQVSVIQRDKEEYKEFIEQWAHELKIPVTSIILTCENNLDHTTRKILLQTKQIEDYLDQVLYYARLGNVEKDYMIKEVCLEEIIDDALLRSKHLLIQSNIAIETESLDFNVYTDTKWLTFIINQIINNSIRYKKDSPILTFRGTSLKDAVQLEIRDNGIGILESEIGRVFRKGFTGSNGRNRKNSTGIGLYLCKQLCDEMGVDIQIQSQVNEHTTVKLIFPTSAHFVE